MTGARTFLAIESSCDETCAAVVRGGEVLSSVVASQVELHQRYGGVVPEVASRRHLETLDAVVAEALDQAGASTTINTVAVTQGPGLVGALLVGLAGAKARAYALGLPLVVVDHLLGHVASAFLADPDLEFPFLCLLASGGHTLLLDVDLDLRVSLMGTTRDDAAGEAFDKGARLLGLPLPGGPAIEALAAHSDSDAVALTPAMVHHDTLDTSFAGIKTALALAVRAGDAAPCDLAAAFQRAIVDTLVASVRKALRAGRPGGGPQWTALAVVGGVAANTQLRRCLQREAISQGGMRLVTIPPQYCSDNAAMIGAAARWCSETEPAEARVVDAYATSPLFRTGFLAPRRFL